MEDTNNTEQSSTSKKQLTVATFKNGNEIMNVLVF